MADLSDYEINKRLAEIAGLEILAKAPRENPALWVVSERMGERAVVGWQPISDWCDLGPLMERFEINAVRLGFPNGKREWSAESLWRPKAEGLAPTWHEASGDSQDLKRAICLAIISAHEEP